jgi:hypothetical protein
MEEEQGGAREAKMETVSLPAEAADSCGRAGPRLQLGRGRDGLLGSELGTAAARIKNKRMT